MGQVNISKNHHKLILVSLAILFIVMYAFIFQAKSSTTTPIPSPQSETMSNEYRSQFLKFSFLVPSGFDVSETGNTIVLTTINNQTIQITRLFGYSNSVEEYIDDVSEKNNLKQSIERVDGNSFYVVKTLTPIKGVDSNISYIKNIDTDTFISISTSSPELYDELDQIAASFEYLGDTEN